MIIYVSLLIYALFKIGFWNRSMLFITIAWFFGSAIISWANVSEVNKNQNYFKYAIKDNFKLAVTVGLIGFIIDMHVFSLTVELIMLPVLSFIYILGEFVKIKKEYSSISRVLNPILAIAGFYLLISAIFSIFSDFQSFLTINNLFTFLLPSTLTFMYLPFIYLLALYAAYDSLYNLLNVWVYKRDKELAKFAKRKIFRAHFLNLRKLNKFLKENSQNLIKLNSKETLLNIIAPFENKNSNDEC